MKNVTLTLAVLLVAGISASPANAQGVGGLLPYTGNNGNAPLTFDQDQGITNIREENPDLFRKVYRIWLRTYPIDTAPPIAKWTQADLHRFVRVYDKKILSQSNTSNEGLYATWFFQNVFDADGGSDGEGEK